MVILRDNLLELTAKNFFKILNDLTLIISV